MGKISKDIYISLRKNIISERYNLSLIFIKYFL